MLSYINYNILKFENQWKQYFISLLLFNIHLSFYQSSKIMNTDTIAPEMENKTYTQALL